MLDKHLVPSQTPGFMMENFDDEVLLYHSVKTQAVYLNKSAALIWALCDGKTTILEIEELLLQNFPEAGDSLAEDISLSLNRFVEIGALEFK
ncbi:MAG: PqqD family peptide modification chaperone [Pseudomonadota bacterium]